ncbi:DUF397 domain-containing protein [Streptomyces sp. MZ04]|uniref:DUF397 domain-containing protein n=1 Tax=Streptomyces sp. MZ04 TaxID=2559236 RepID=UPI00107EBF51|nr:DUF397 domain-containing protein [Streptomyces sp. MZ04]TGA91587.1 DUF397 domain-containing protein [Streptomyces sp. MZ04]
MTTAKTWQKSSFSGGGVGNDCVELATTSSHIHLRESEAPTTRLTTALAALANLLQAVKANAPLNTPAGGPPA